MRAAAGSAISEAAAGIAWWRSIVGYFAFTRGDGAIRELDGLRGLAIILVLLRHATLPFQKGEVVAPVFGLDIATPFLNGWIGVDLFFVLSGFLIAHHIAALHERCRGRVPWTRYLAKRLLRIVPAYYCVLFVVAGGLVPLYRIPAGDVSASLVHHLLFLQDYLGADIVVAFWSLGVEEKFYLLAPVLMLPLLRMREPVHQAVFVLALAMLVLLVRVWAATTYVGVDSYEAFFPAFRSPFHFSADGLLIGVFCAVVYRQRCAFPWLTRGRRPGYLFWVGLFAVAGLLFVEPLMGEITWFDKTLQPTVIAVSFAAMMLAMLLGGGPRQVFRTDSLFGLAKLSYCLYLVHMPLIAISMAIVAKPGGFWLFVPVFLTLSIAAALLLHYIVEKPFLLIKDRF